MKNITSMSVEEMLDELAELRSAVDELTKTMQKLIDGKIPEDIRQAIRDIQMEFNEKIAVATVRSGALEVEIKAQCKVFMETRVGTSLQATFAEVHGWDMDKLRTYRSKHPELAVCELVQKRVTIEKIKPAKNDKGKQDGK